MVTPSFVGPPTAELERKLENDPYVGGAPLGQMISALSTHMGASGPFLGLCFLALLVLQNLCCRSEGLDKQQLQQFEFQPSELAKLPWPHGGFGSRSSQAGFVRKLVAGNSANLRSPDWGREEWMKGAVRRSRARADEIGALYETRKVDYSAWLEARAVDPASSTAQLVDEFAASSPLVSQGFASPEYYLSLKVGTPAQDTLLIVDTGSELTWVECGPCSTCPSNLTFDPTKSTSYSVLSCSDAVCAHLTGAAQSCDSSVQECQFQISYGDGAATSGDISTDVVATQPVSDGVSKGASDRKFVLGCAQHTEGLSDLPASGLLGLNRGPLSFASQVDAKKFSYCLPDRFAADASQGYIFFGDLPETVNASAGLEWKRTPMLTNALLSGTYFLGVTGLSVGDELVGIPQSALSIDAATGSGGVLLDTGTTVQILRADVYDPLMTALDAQTVGLTRNTVAQAELGSGPCYDVPDASKLSSAVPNLTVHLQGGEDWKLPMNNYLWPLTPKRDLYCYAFTSSSHTFSIFGNMLQQNFLIEHDLGKDMLSISGLTDCSLQAGERFLQ